MELARVRCKNIETIHAFTTRDRINTWHVPQNYGSLGASAGNAVEMRPTTESRHTVLLKQVMCASYP
jgi:hypothetical protein